MSRRKILKSIHITSTIWFIVCVGYILVLALRQAGVHWWVVFSLSGYSVLIVLLLISLYLFAIYRGVSSSQTIKKEHPLTSTTYYAMFYVVTPLWGGLAGCLGTIGMGTFSQFLMGIALGTLWTTFLVWVIVDPVTGLLEIFLPPASRRHRAQRLAQAKALRQSRQRDRESLLKEVLVEEELERRRWQKALEPQAEKLAGLLTTNGADFKQAECEAVGIGVKAWQIGGLSCMRELRNMAMALAKEPNESVVDYVGVWWDGIGSWREPSLA